MILRIQRWDEGWAGRAGREQWLGTAQGPSHCCLLHSKLGNLGSRDQCGFSLKVRKE